MAQEKRQHATARRTRLLKVLFAFGAILLLGAGLAVFLLRDIPFGWRFDTALTLTAVGLWLVLSSAAVRFLVARRLWLKGIGALVALVAIAWTALALVVAIDHRMLYFRGPPPRPTPAQWAEDARFLAAQMKEKHADLSSLIDEATFDAAVEEIAARIAEPSDRRAPMELFRLAALPNDGHTFPFIFMPCFDLHAYPIRLYGFEEGWFVIEAGRAHQELVGLQLTRVGDVPIDTLYRDHDLLLSAESPSHRRERFAYMVGIAEWLQAHGVADDLRQATFTFADSTGGELTRTLTSDSLIRNLYWTSMRTIDSDRHPAFSNPRREHYRLQWLEDRQTLYVQYNQCVEQPERETMAAFASRVAEIIEGHDVERLIVDLRNNDGGDDQISQALLETIVGSTKVTRPGRLFALIGRRTFSAAVMFVAQLQLQTPVILVGEPTSQGPSFFGGPEVVELPHCRLQFAISRHRTVASLPIDQRREILPDVAVPTTFRDFREGRDTVLEAALAWSTSEPETIPLDACAVERYAGRYLLTPLVALDVEHDGTGLTLQVSDFFPGSPCRFTSPMRAISRDRFATNIRQVTVEYPPDQQSVAPHLTLSWMGARHRLERAPAGHALPLELLAEGRIDEARQALLANKEPCLAQFPGLEARLNRLGYDLLRAQETSQAIQVFTLNVDLFPQSSNVYDSLGEAYMENGDDELAVSNYRKSLELNPENENAKQMLARMGQSI